jgi:hypothetical protein
MTANRGWYLEYVKQVKGERDLLSVFPHNSSFGRARFHVWLDTSANSLDLPGDKWRDLFSHVAHRCHIRLTR